ncbi:MAG: Crp/Fnr family transcriptional regulator [Armatimonadetes bacterium]|nr:Crp/Fnr family transcriptional regulator [Armatimonadota bacterium]
MEHGRLLSSLPLEERDAILKVATRQELRAGEVLFRADDRPAHVYFPISGMLAVSEETGKGDRRITALIDSRGFANFTFALPEPVSAQMDTWAVLDTPLYAVPVDSARQLASQLPALAAALLGYLGWTTRRMSDYLRISADYGVKERAAATLLEFAQMLGGNAVPVPQKVLADRIGARRETVAVALGQLREDRVVRTRYRKVLINNLDLLRAAAGGAAWRLE